MFRLFVSSVSFAGQNKFDGSISKEIETLEKLENFDVGKITSFVVVASQRLVSRLSFTQYKSFEVLTHIFNATCEQLVAELQGSCLPKSGRCAILK